LDLSIRARALCASLVAAASAAWRAPPPPPFVSLCRAASAAVSEDAVVASLHVTTMMGSQYALQPHALAARTRNS
jgi:hypothetical protein